MIDYENVLKQFKKYLEKFDTNDEMIKLKISHSYHVADLAGKLAKRLELSEEKIILAKTIGLLHDIGRFVQYEKAKTYSDIKSRIDHAEIAIDYLSKEKHIQDFAIPKKDEFIVLKAISNHNKLKIENGLSKEELFFAKLIRDADKIDILRQEATLMYNWKYYTALSDNVRNSFYKHFLINKNDIKNQSDSIVVEIAYVFDIEFKESYELLKDTDNLELFLSVIDVSKEQEQEFEAIKQEIRNYLEERIRE